MKKILVGLITALILIGCSSKDEQLMNVEPILVIGKELSSLELNDQFEKQQTLNPATTKLVFAFAKEPAHICNDFFETMPKTYLQDNNTQFIADVSAAPMLIRSAFIVPGLKKLEHTVLLLDDEAKAAPFKKDMNAEAITVVYLQNSMITDIKNVSSAQELQALIEAK